MITMKWAAFFLFLLLNSCADRIRLAEEEHVRIVDDSGDIRRFLVSEAKLQLAERSREKFDAEAVRLKERQGYVSPLRRRLLDGLTSAAGFNVESVTDANIVETLPDCRCLLSEIYTNRMVRIQINSGPLKGRIGWVCDDKVRRLNVWP
jgi:hypothetical protein